ncbi:MAG TPA: hypothetical protein VK993_15540 [Chthoniobacterales bacterium]|nr:hypothetical protein [Chthoniobacterales bacterium]
MSTEADNMSPAPNEAGGKSAGDRLKTVAQAAMSDAKTGGEMMGEQPTPNIVDMATVEQIMRDWPKMAQTAAKEMISKYGPPNEVMESRFIWYNNGPWKRCTVYRDEIPHHFPNPHSDVLEGVIDYQVPLEKISELVKFDGSLVVERTKGEVISRCDMEAANFLALNMMHEIVTGNMTAEQARDFLTETAAAYSMSRSAPHAEAFMFDLPKGDTNEPDHTTILPDMLKQGIAKVTDTFR